LLLRIFPLGTPLSGPSLPRLPALQFRIGAISVHFQKSSLDRQLCPFSGFTPFHRHIFLLALKLKTLIMINHATNIVSQQGHAMVKDTEKE
jgi:hypothetical protein